MCSLIAKLSRDRACPVGSLSQFDPAAGARGSTHAASHSLNTLAAAGTGHQGVCQTHMGVSTVLLKLSQCSRIMDSYQDCVRRRPRDHDVRSLREAAPQQPPHVAERAARLFACKSCIHLASRGHSVIPSRQSYLVLENTYMHPFGVESPEHVACAAYASRRNATGRTVAGVCLCRWFVNICKASLAGVRSTRSVPTLVRCALSNG